MELHTHTHTHTHSCKYTRRQASSFFVSLPSCYQFSTFFHGLRLRHRRDSLIRVGERERERERKKSVSSLIFFVVVQALAAFLGLHIDIES
jgi:hypothetical protein